jgi:uncharacterized protein YcnI
MSRALRGTAVLFAAGLAGALALPGAASAHVTVASAGDAVQGEFARLAFRVPTESDTLSTTKVDVYLPENQPIASVSTMPVPGWTVAVQTKKLPTPIKTDDGEVTVAVSQVTWTAGANAAIKAGEFQEFPVSLGPLPKTDKLVFKTLQTYSDGSIVRWIDVPASDGSEGDHPAPTLALKPAGATTGPADPKPGGTGLALAFGIAGLVAGVGGLVLGALAYLRTRSGDRERRPLAATGSGDR